MLGRDEGLQESFEEFAASRRGALLRTAYLLTGSVEDAEDLVQVALLLAVGKWARIADRPEPYVRRILAREAISRWRGRRWREVGTAEVPDLLTSEVDHARRVAVVSALMELGPRQRAVVVLRYFDDLTERETAAQLGLSVGTVKSHAREALAALRTRFPALVDAMA